MNPMAGELHISKVEGKRHISITQLDTLSKCGEQYRRKYVLHQKGPKGLTLYVGIAVDRAVTMNLDRKMMQGSPMSLEEIRELTVSAYRKCIQEAREGDEGILFKEDELLEGEEISIANAEAKAVRLARLHAIEVAPNLKPIYLQRPLSVELPGYPFDLGGIIDVQELDSVRDTKTKGTTPPKTVANDDDQLTVYALLVFMNDGAIPPRLILDCLVDLKTPVYKPFETTRTEEDFDVLLRRIHAGYEAIEKGAFIPARESDWWCSKNSCEFHSTCKYVKQARRPAA